MTFLKRAAQLVRAPGRKVESLVNYLDSYESSPYEKQALDKMIFHFQSKKDLEEWEVQCDAEIGGKSVASLEPTASGKARFYGSLNCEAPDWLAHSGYATIYSKERRNNALLEVSASEKLTSNNGYHGVEMRVRGDGRRYKLTMDVEGMWRPLGEMSFQYFMNTRGGPEYEIFRMPFSKFIRTAQGGYIQEQFDVEKTQITSLGVLLADGLSGPFQMELDYIKFIHIPNSEDFDKMDRRKPHTTNLMTYEDL